MPYSCPSSKKICWILVCNEDNHGRGYLFIIVHTWLNDGLSSMIRSCGITVRHRFNHIKEFDSPYDTVNWKELPFHFLNKILQLLDNHNKNQNSLALEWAQPTKSPWFWFMMYFIDTHQYYRSYKTIKKWIKIWMMKIKERTHLLCKKYQIWRDIKDQKFTSPKNKEKTRSNGRRAMMSYLDKSNGHFNKKHRGQTKTTIMFQFSSVPSKTNQQTIEMCHLWYSSLQKRQAKKYLLF